MLHSTPQVAWGAKGRTRRRKGKVSVEARNRALQKARAQLEAADMGQTGEKVRARRDRVENEVLSSMEEDIDFEGLSEGSGSGEDIPSSELLRGALWCASIAYRFPWVLSSE